MINWYQMFVVSNPQIEGYQEKETCRFINFFSYTSEIHAADYVCVCVKFLADLLNIYNYIHYCRTPRELF